MKNELIKKRDELQAQIDAINTALALLPSKAPDKKQHPAKTVKGQIIAELKKHPATSAELVAAIRAKKNSTRAVISQLKTSGLVSKQGDRYMLN